MSSSIISSNRPQLVFGTQYSAGVFNGLMVIGEDRFEFLRLLSVIQKLGIKTLDTAPIYARTKAEMLVGQHGWQGKVWTKVGVDVSRTLPELNYSEASMYNGLLDSLKRLRLCKVDTVFLHNPSMETIDSTEFASLKIAWCKELGLCDRIGISLHNDSDMMALANRPARDLDLLMLELPYQPTDWYVLADLSAYYQIALRGVFRQGKWFKQIFGEDRQVQIVDHILRIIERINPAYLVIAPRTVAQAQDYCMLIERLKAE